MADLTSARPTGAPDGNMVRAPRRVLPRSRQTGNRPGARGRWERGREGQIPTFLPSCTWSSRRSSSPGSCGCAPFVRTCRTTSDRAPCCKQKIRAGSLSSGFLERGGGGGGASRRSRIAEGKRGGRERERCDLPFRPEHGIGRYREKAGAANRTGLRRCGRWPNWRGSSPDRPTPREKRQQARRSPATTRSAGFFFSPRVHRDSVYTRRVPSPSYTYTHSAARVTSLFSPSVCPLPCFLPLSARPASKPRVARSFPRPRRCRCRLPRQRAVPCVRAPSRRSTMPHNSRFPFVDTAANPRRRRRYAATLHRQPLQPLAAAPLNAPAPLNASRCEACIFLLFISL